MNAYFLTQSGQLFGLQNGDEFMLQALAIGTSTGSGAAKRRKALQEDDDEVVEIVKHMMQFLEP